MITFIATLRVAPDNREELETLLASVRDASRASEPGVVYYDFACHVSQSDTIVVIEVYRDAAAHAAHMKAAWVIGSIPRSAELVQDIDVQQYVSPGTEPAIRRFNQG